MKAAKGGKEVCILNISYLMMISNILLEAWLVQKLKGFYHDRLSDIEIPSGHTYKSGAPLMSVSAFLSVL